jgi:hypothetical protein
MNRRETVSLLAGALFAAVSGGAAARAAALAETLDIVGGLSAAEALAPPDKFYALSRILAGRRNLSRSASDRLFPYFAEEPWGLDNLARTLDLLLAGLRKPGAPQRTATEIVPELDPDTRWFAEHVLTTWYLGIYYHERLVRRVLYEDALQWEAVKGLVPIPGMSGQAFGYWTEPPVPTAGAAAQ